MIHPKAGETLPPPLADLQTRYPGWSIWTSNGDGGFTPRCYATRLGELTDHQIGHGLAMTVQDATPDGLSGLLDRQAELEARLAGQGHA